MGHHPAQGQGTLVGLGHAQAPAKQAEQGWGPEQTGEEGRGAGGIPRGLQPLSVPQLREGATAAIGPHVLSAEDEDSSAEEVTYSIQPPANGKVVLRSAPGTEVRRFTQAQINNGLIFFVHQGRAGLRCPSLTPHMREGTPHCATKADTNPITQHPGPTCARLTAGCSPPCPT